MKYLGLFGLYSLIIGLIELYSYIVAILKPGYAHTVFTSTFALGVIGLILGIIGVLKDQNKTFAIIGMILSSLPIIVLIYLIFYSE